MIQSNFDKVKSRLLFHFTRIREFTIEILSLINYSKLTRLLSPEVSKYLSWVEYARV